MSGVFEFIQRDPTILIPFGALSFVFYSVGRVIHNLITGQRAYEPAVLNYEPKPDPNERVPAREAALQPRIV
jgi:hypothetical protein